MVAGEPWDMIWFFEESERKRRKKGQKRKRKGFDEDEEGMPLDEEYDGF